MIALDYVKLKSGKVVSFGWGGLTIHNRPGAVQSSATGGMWTHDPAKLAYVPQDPDPCEWMHLSKEEHLEVVDRIIDGWETWRQEVEDGKR